MLVELIKYIIAVMGLSSSSLGGIAGVCQSNTRTIPLAAAGNVVRPLGGHLGVILAR